MYVCVRYVYTDTFVYPGVPRQGFDISMDEVEHNLLSTLGFLKGLELTMRLIAFGLLYGGIPCHSYTWISSATHARCASQPDGAPWPFVVQGSTLLCRYMVLALVAIARGSVWMAENPSRTSIDIMPAMQHLMSERLRPLMVRWLGAHLVTEACMENQCVLCIILGLSVKTKL